MFTVTGNKRPIAFTKKQLKLDRARAKSVGVDVKSMYLDQQGHAVYVCCPDGLVYKSSKRYF